MRRLAILCPLVIFTLLVVMSSIGCRSQAVRYNEHGIALLSKGWYEQAILEFSRAIELAPEYGEAFSNRGVVYAYQGEYDKAIADLNRAIELDLTSSEAFSNRGVVYAFQGEYDKAMADFNKAMDLDPNNIQAITNRRLVRQAQEKGAVTMADLEICLELSQYPSQRTDNTTSCLIIKRPPILLVYGFQLTSFDVDEIWREMARYLTGKDVYKAGDWEWVYNESQAFASDFSMKRLEGDFFVVYISNYTHDTSDGTRLDIQYYAQSLAAEIELIKDKERVTRVDVVAYSMGGLVTRTYIENEDLRDNPYRTEYKDDIRKLIMLGTPNHGTYFADLFSRAADWKSVQQMKVGSAFLLELNGGVTGKQNKVEYSAIAGNAYQCGPGMQDPLAELLCALSRQEENDGVVCVKCVKLEKQNGLSEIPESRWLVLRLTHSELRGLPVGPLVEDILISPILNEQ